MASLGKQRGAALLAILVVLVIVGLAAGMAGSTWKTIMQREREAELLFRGDQYRRAIESYAKVSPGAKNLPDKLEDLLKDPRTGQTVRHLRRLYTDPMTGEDFATIRTGGGIQGLAGASATTAGITGVHSKSTTAPFKAAGFPKIYEGFTGALRYSDWRFIHVPVPVKVPPPKRKKKPVQMRPEESY